MTHGVEQKIRDARKLRLLAALLRDADFDEEQVWARIVENIADRIEGPCT